MNPWISRRDMLRQSGLGFGSLALAGLMEQAGLLAAPAEPAPHGGPATAAALDLKPKPAHFAPRAKAVIQLFQNGGPSQMDLFDPKPELTRRAGQPHPQGVETFQLGNKNILLGTPFKFAPRGQSGMEISEALPHLGSIADDLCLVRSMFTENNNHPFAISMFQTGKTFAGYPAMGSWICYALGTENRSLPGYIVLRDPAGYNTSGKTVWSSGWMPAVYQGTEFSSSGSPVHYLQPATPVPDPVRRRSLEYLAELNAEHQVGHPADSELDARIQNFELAARMQLAAGEVLDLSTESQRRVSCTAWTIPPPPLTARAACWPVGWSRRASASCRSFRLWIRIFSPGTSHSNLEGGHPAPSPRTPISRVAALIKDLKQRGLLDETIVLWTGEFGRLPITEGVPGDPIVGRDHNRHAFSLLVAGGGFKAGHVHGATDEFGYAAVENRVSVPDLQATLLHQLASITRVSTIPMPAARSG